MYVTEHIVVVVLLCTMYLKTSPCFCSLSTGWYYCSIYSLYQGHLYKDFKCYIAMFLKNIIWWAIMISCELQAKLHFDKLELYMSFTITYNAVSIYSAMIPGEFYLVTGWKWWIMFEITFEKSIIMHIKSIWGRQINCWYFFGILNSSYISNSTFFPLCKKKSCPWWNQIFKGGKRCDTIVFEKQRMQELLCCR